MISKFSDVERKLPRRLFVEIFLGVAYWKDTDGKLYAVDLIDEATGALLLPVENNHIRWCDCWFIDANNKIYFRKTDHPWPFGFKDGDDLLVPWNRWRPQTDEERAAALPI